MTQNQEKSKEIAKNLRMYYFEVGNDDALHKTTSEFECDWSAMKMAEWKDDYYKKLLDLLVKSGANADIITEYIENCI